MAQASPSNHSTLPTFAIVPGAWHSPSHWEDVISRLQAVGYPTCSLQLPSVGSPNPNDVSTTTDADFIRDNVLRPLLDAGKT